MVVCNKGKSVVSLFQYKPIKVYTMYITRENLNTHLKLAVKDECASNPCVHGVCADMLNGFECTCNAGYQGSFCDQGKKYTMVARALHIF